MKKTALLIAAAVLLLSVCTASAADMRTFDTALRAASGTDAEWSTETGGVHVMKAGTYTEIRLTTDSDGTIAAMEIISACAIGDDAAEAGRELSRTAREAVTALYEADGMLTALTAEEVNSGLKQLLAPYSGSGETGGTVRLAGRNAVLTRSAADGVTVYILTVGNGAGSGAEAAI